MADDATVQAEVASTIVSEQAVLPTPEEQAADIVDLDELTQGSEAEESPDPEEAETQTEEAQAEGEDQSQEQSEESEEAAEGEEAETAEGEEADASEDEGESEDTDEGEEGDEEVTELLEFDFGGNKLQVPADQIPDELATKVQDFVDGTWKDYQQKSQTNAETAKKLEAQQDATDKLAALNGVALETYAKGLNLAMEVQELQQVDLRKLWEGDESDRETARRVSDALSQKQVELQQTIALVGQQETQFTQAQQDDLARRSEEGKKVLEARFKDFEKTKAPEVVKYAVDQYGMEQSEADLWALNPVVTEMAYKAMLYDQQQAKAQKAKTRVRKPKPAARPIKGQASTGGRAQPAGRDPEKMTMSQLGKHLGLQPDLD